MGGADNTAEEDPLLSLDSSGHTSAPSSASTSTMTTASDDDPDDERRSFLSGVEESGPPRKHLNRTKIAFFGSKRGVWVSHSRLLCLVMVLDLMTLSVQVRPLLLSPLNKYSNACVSQTLSGTSTATLMGANGLSFWRSRSHVPEREVR